MLNNHDIYIKENVDINEFIMAKMIYNANIVNTPKIVGYDRIKKVMKMEKIKGCLSLSDFYGEKDENIPPNIYEDIRIIIKKLSELGIDYVDITGYNFMLNPYTMKIYIIDFEHAYVREIKKNIDPFISKFLDGYDGWNPKFK